MSALAFMRGCAVVTVASLLAACSAGSTGTPVPLQAQSQTRGTASVAGRLTPQTVAERADLGATGFGKVPQPLRPGGSLTAPKRARHSDVACTTVSPSADVLAGLEEPGSTATAAYVIDTPSGTYTKQNFDGSECDIAVYVASTASGVTIQDSAIHDGIRAGLVVDGAPSVKVYGDEAYDNGDHSGTTYAPDGVQYGFGMMFVNAGTSENVADNSVFNYQKDGILAFDNVTLSLTQNDVTGAGPVNYIASNGIEMDGVTFTKFAGNRVSLNQYTGPTYGASGYLVCGDTLNGTPETKALVKKGGNLALYNDIEIYVSPNSNCS